MSNARQKSGSKASRIKSPNQSRQVAHGRAQTEQRRAIRKLILDATVGLLVRHGISKLRTEDVARSAGVSRGVLLRHFRTKQQLVLVAIRDAADQGLERSQQRAMFARSGRGVAGIIDAVIDDATDVFFGRGSLIGFALGLEPIHPPLSRAVFGTTRRFTLAVEAIWSETLRSHGLPTDIANDVLDLTLSIVLGLRVRSFMEDNPARRAHLTAVWQAMIRAYLLVHLTEFRLARAVPDVHVPAGQAPQRTATVIEFKPAPRVRRTEPKTPTDRGRKKL